MFVNINIWNLYLNLPGLLLNAYIFFVTLFSVPFPIWNLFNVVLGNPVPGLYELYPPSIQGLFLYRFLCTQLRNLRLHLPQDSLHNSFPYLLNINPQCLWR